ncbi:MAG: glycosyltransferase family 39 protein [Solirubrobacterales bacterium]
MPSGLRNWLTPLAWVAMVAAILLLLFPPGFPNYDTIYSLLWGRELGGGFSPDRGAALPPTPHPLAELFGLLASPLGDGAIELTMIVAYVALGLVGYLVYRLGALWFDRPIGAVAALIVLTRAPFLSNGLRAYVDLPYIALTLAALVLVTKGGSRPTQRNALSVLSLLALAGLLRPEAWLFSIAYLAYLIYLALDPTQLPLLRRRRQPSGREQETDEPLDRPDPAAPAGTEVEAQENTGKATAGEEGGSPGPADARTGEEGVPLEPADTQKRRLIKPRSN